MLSKVSLFLLLIILYPFAFASTYHLEPQKGSLKFEAVGQPGFIKINGKGEGPKGELTVENDLLSGQLEYDLTQLDTGIGFRDRHMKENYLNTKKYPNARIVFEKQKINLTQKVNQKIHGKLMFHGETKETEVQFNIDDSKVTAQMNVLLKNFAIEIPTYAGITMAENVKVETTFEAEKQPDK